jgi:hypothetical protein
LREREKHRTSRRCFSLFRHVAGQDGVRAYRSGDAFAHARLPWLSFTIDEFFAGLDEYGF